MSEYNKFIEDWVEHVVENVPIEVHRPEAKGSPPEISIYTCVCGREGTVNQYGITHCQCSAFVGWYWLMNGDNWILVGFARRDQEQEMFLQDGL